MIRIISRKEGFRRCGIAHSEKATDYDDDRFTKKELARLEAEPMLIVLEVPNPDSENPEKLTVPKLKNLLDTLKIEYPADAVKADLIKLLKENTAAPPEE